MNPRRLSSTVALQAIHNDDADALVSAITQDPTLLNFRNHLHENLLQLAIKYSTEDVIEKMLAAIPPAKAVRMAEKVNLSGNTALHVAAALHTVRVATFIVNLLADRAELVAIKINYAGKLPLELLSINVYQTDSFFTLLEKITYPKNKDKLHDRIQIHTVLANYPEINHQLEFHFRLACFGINTTRDILKLSSTHPNMNLWNVTSRTLLNRRIDNFRASLRSQLKRVKYLSMDRDTRNLLIQKLYLQAAREHRVGNCQEYAEIVAMLLKKIFPNLPLAVVYIEGGDHWFVVIGISHNSSSDYKTWNKNAVVIDAWAGKTFKVDELELQLRNYWWYPKNGTRILTFFEPKYHKLKIAYEPFIYFSPWDSTSAKTLQSFKLLFQEEKNFLPLAPSTQKNIIPDEEITEEKTYFATQKTNLFTPQTSTVNPAISASQNKPARSSRVR